MRFSDDIYILRDSTAIVVCDCPKNVVDRDLETVGEIDSVQATICKLCNQGYIDLAFSDPTSSCIR